MSLTLRVGLPLLVLSIADKAGAGSDSAKDIALITFLIADLIDIGATFGIDFDEEQRKKDAAKAKLTVMPMRGGGAVVGIAGGF